MQIKVILHGNLKAIYSDKPEEINLQIDDSTSVMNVLGELEISPLVVTTVLIDGDTKDKQALLKKENEKLELIGPLAGG